jgi:hypothetical protein
MVPGVAVGTDVSPPPLTVIITASELEHDEAVEVAVNVKVVVAARLTVAGSSIEAFTSCAEGDQL